MTNKAIYMVIIFCLFLIVTLLSSNSSFAQQLLQGGVQETWTVQKAKEELFNNMEYLKDLGWASPTDINYKLIMNAIKQGKSKVKNYNITVFYDDNLDFESYAINEEGKSNSFFFDSSGNLESVSYDYHKNNYPRKIYNYTYPSGKLNHASLIIAPGDSYIFEPDGTFNCHWVNHKSYDENGDIVMYRGSLKRSF